MNEQSKAKPLQKKRGRPTSCTPEVQAKIIKAVESGAYIVVAAQAAEISERAFYAWVKQAESGKEPYLGFIQSLKTLGAQAEIKHTKEMLTGGKRFLPCATWLERRHRLRCGRSNRFISQDTRPIAVTIKIGDRKMIVGDPKAIDVAPGNNIPARRNDFQPSDLQFVRNGKAQQSQGFLGRVSMAITAMHAQMKCFTAPDPFPVFTGTGVGPPWPRSYAGDPWLPTSPISLRAMVKPGRIFFPQKGLSSPRHHHILCRLEGLYRKQGVDPSQLWHYECMSN